MPKLSNVALPVAVRDSSTRRDDVSTAHTMRDTRNPMANTKPDSRSLMPEFIARVYSCRIDYLRDLSFTSSLCRNRAAVFGVEINPKLEAPTKHQSVKLPKAVFS